MHFLHLLGGVRAFICTSLKTLILARRQGKKQGRVLVLMIKCFYGRRHWIEFSKSDEQNQIITVHRGAPLHFIVHRS
jgi:hypothetical protein